MDTYIRQTDYDSQSIYGAVQSVTVKGIWTKVKVTANILLWTTVTFVSWVVVVVKRTHGRVCVTARPIQLLSVEYRATYYRDKSVGLESVINMCFKTKCGGCGKATWAGKVSTISVIRSPI